MVASKTWRFYYYQYAGKTPSIYLNSSEEGKEVANILRKNGVEIKDEWYSKYDANKTPSTPKTQITQPLLLPVRYLNEIVTPSEITDWEELLKKENYLRLKSYEKSGSNFYIIN